MRDRRISKPRHKLKKLPLAIILVLLIVTVSGIFFPNIKNHLIQSQRVKTLSSVDIPDWISEEYINIHDSARTGNKLKRLNNIVVHYVGNPETTAKQNRDFFNNDGTDVSSHFVVGLEGEIIQCLPLDEISAASNHRNGDTISVEVCHPDDSGRYNKQTYSSLIKLLTWLCSTLDLSAEDVIRHYDVTGKLCPLYYVENPEEWEMLINDLMLSLNAYNKID